MNDISNDPFRILALSGGGYRGLFTARILQLLEERSAEPLWKGFDLIAGTSIGGINALTIAAGIPAEKAVDFFIRQGPRVFKKMRWGKGGFFRPRYTNTGLREVLEEIFEGRTMADLKTKVLIPSINYTKGAPQLFKTAHNPNFSMDANRTLVDVAMSTSAAPTYFPLHRTSFGDMVDGGLVANHPGLFAAVEARKFLGILEKQMHMLHVGTMSTGPTTSGKELDFGIRQWLVPKPRLIELILASQEKSTDFIMGFMLGERYHSIDKPPSKEQIDTIGLDVFNEKASNVLLQSAEAAFQDAVGKEALRFTFQLTGGSHVQSVP